jgi:hypothetical protein
MKLISNMLKYNHMITQTNIGKALLAILLQERVGSDSDSGGGLAGQLGLEMGS